MWRLHRYYLRELAVNAGITFLILFAVVLVSLVYRGIQRSQGGTAVDALMITLYFALDSLPHLLTIAFLIATVTTFTRAAQDRELIAIRAAGVSPRVPMNVAVLVGIVLSCLASFANHYVIPEVHFRKYRVIAEIVRSAFLNLRLDTDRIKVLDTGYVITARRRDEDGLRDCTVYCPRPLDALLRSPVLFVDRIAMSPIDEHAESMSLVLSGIRDPIGEGRPGDLRFEVSSDAVGVRGSREDRDEDLRSDQLLSEVLRGVHRRPDEAVYTLFRRCCFSLMPALLAPIGFCIAEFARERGRVMALVLALVPLGIFYLGEVLGARLLLSTQNPWVGWMPALLLTVAGVPFVWRQLRR
jgi:lipopolysaccharide export LptBFGC system permease protein LptF